LQSSDKCRVSVFIFCIIGLITIALYGQGYNYYLDIKEYQRFHSTLEILFTVVISSIFLITSYSYSFEKNQRYSIPGMLFLIVALVNTSHIYYAFDENMLEFRVLLSNIVNIILCISTFMLLITTEKDLKIQKRSILIIPLLASISLLIYISLGWKLENIVLSYNPTVSFAKNTFYAGLEIAYIVQLIIAFKQYSKDKSEHNYNIIYVILCLILYTLYFFLYTTYTDIYSIIAHFIRFAASLFLFKIYFITFIKVPYEKMVEAKKLAEEASSIKTDFIINMSHELRTPINVILNAAKLVGKGHDSYKYVKSIEKSTHRMHKVCESILEFNEIENGDISLDYRETDVVFLVDEILEEADEIADSKALEIAFDFKNNDVILTDSEKLKKIVLNLISNSVKYAPVGGFVNIELDINECLTLKVFNNGPHIPQSEIVNIFNKFYKVKSDELESTEGLGIGLYISKRYAEILGGYIKVLNYENLTGYMLVIPTIKIDKPSSRIDSYNVKGFFSDIG
jgi:signal transduction histidine kinase